MIVTLLTKRSMTAIIFFIAFSPTFYRISIPDRMVNNFFEIL